MLDLSRDSIHNAIYDGIKRGITVAMDNHAYGSAVILLFSAIDAMAYLGLPQGREDVTKSDFISWVERYIHFEGKEQLTGADLYGARCAMVHTYGVRSRMSRAGECRIVGYMSEAYPPVQYNPSISTELVMLSVPALRDAVFKGIDNFLIYTYSDKDRARLAEERVKNFVHLIRFEDANT